MTHFKSYVGSIVLAGLLLQGCGGSDNSTDSVDTQIDTPADTPSASFVKAQAKFNTATAAFAGASTEDVAKAQSELTLKMLALYNSDADVKAFMDKLMAENGASKIEAATAMAESITTTTSTQQAPSRGLLSGLTDKVKDALTDTLDTSVGNSVTGAAFDVVLNSEGVTVVMIDLARKSETTSQIMVDSLEANWELTYKMCPMLRESTEFGEKFTALAEEMPMVGEFFFARIDSTMYACLADAMLLSNDNSVHDDSVSMSTNGYMGLLMDRYAAKFFITPEENVSAQDRETRRDDNFISLLLDTGANATYDSATQTFTGHGDANELTNEKFFYSLFKTPDSTNSFVNAMKKVDLSTRVMLMDTIFMGGKMGAENIDTLQGKMNVIAIGSSMYDGIYGTSDAATAQQQAGYGFGAYAGAFLGFAGLIPSDRFLPYGKAFMDAGYQYASFHGIDVWEGVYAAGKDAWNNYQETSDTAEENANGAPSRSAGKGIIASDWYDDTLDLLSQAWTNAASDLDFSTLYDSFSDENTSLVATLTDSANIAYATVLDGRDENNNTVYGTNISNGLVNNDDVYGVHGLIELAMQEDIYYLECGNRSTDYIDGLDVTCENNTSYTMDNAKAGFRLPPFADLTMDFAYTTAKDGAMAYADKNFDAAFFADINASQLIDYLGLDANNTYIPNWMLAINWLKAPELISNSDYADYDYAFDFNSGYLDIYVISKEENLSNVIDFSALTTTEIVKVEMGDDSIIAVDEAGLTIDNYYVYKVRAVTPADVEAALALLAGYKDSALEAIGIDSSNTADVATEDSNTTAG